MWLSASDAGLYNVLSRAKLGREEWVTSALRTSDGDEYAKDASQAYLVMRDGATM